MLEIDAEENLIYSNQKAREVGIVGKIEVGSENRRDQAFASVEFNSNGRFFASKKGRDKISVRKTVDKYLLRSAHNGGVC